MALLASMFFCLSSTVAYAAVSPVKVSHRKEGEIQYVVGQIRIEHPPEKVWPILANPFEFEEKISPKFKTVKLITDSADLSVASCRVEIGFLFPAIKYTAESRYEAGRKITFRSIAGDLKDFRGTWELVPANGGKHCDVIYSMYVVPGIPVPQWLVRQGIKFELPHTLSGLKNRVDQIYAGQDTPVQRRIAAAGSVSL